MGVRKALETCGFWLPQKILCPFLVFLQLYKVKVTSFMFPFDPPPKKIRKYVVRDVLKNGFPENSSNNSSDRHM